MSPTLELRGLRKNFGEVAAVSDVSLVVSAGTIFGLLGPNGAGKTTTIRMVMDIIGPDEGEVCVFGHPRTRADLDNIGYLPEERGLYRRMTVEEQLVFLGELHGLSRSSALERIERWLERVGLAEWQKNKVEELSKGMQQKIQLVATLLHEPDLLILDEPFSGLDPINQVLFKEVLDDYRATGRAVLFSTHVMEQAERLCDHIGLIAHGRVILDGELLAIKREIAGHSFRIEAEGDLDALEAVPGVEQAFVENGRARVVVAESVDGPTLLAELVGRYRVRGFGSEEPTLEEIFVKAVRDAE